MTFKELIQKNTWETLATPFLEIYPEAEENMQGYKMVFEKLKTMNPKETYHELLIKSYENNIQNVKYPQCNSLCLISFYLEKE